MIHYSICPSRPQAHMFDVVLTIDAGCTSTLKDGITLRLPAWIPGSYMIRDFSKNIVQLRAEADGQAVEYTRIDKSTWRFPFVDGALTVAYSVYAWDLSVRSAHLDQTHGFFNGTSVFFEVLGCDHLPHRVTLKSPIQPELSDWKVATSMTRNGAPKYGFGDYIAENYDELIDHPVEMGEFTLGEFDVFGVPHCIAITGKHSADMPRLCADLKTICEYEIDFFGKPAPMDEYVFMCTVTGSDYGGLEHRASTALMAARHCLPHSSDKHVNTDYMSFLGLCSHEYFHTWNVKRIKPAKFTPLDLSKEQHTELLWAFEGITSYYDDLILVRTGLISAEQYLDLIAKTLTRVYLGTGRLKQTVAESSFDAWTKFYKQDENAPNAIISYYTKGMLVALCLDAFIREHSGNQSSLDDLVKTLWLRFGKDADGRAQGVPEQAFPELVIEQLTPFGVDNLAQKVRAFFDLALYLTQELPVQDALAYMGVNLNWVAKEHEQDTGQFVPVFNPSKTQKVLDLGVKYTESPQGLKVSHVFDEGAAQEAGLSAGDVIIAIDGLKASKSLLKRTLLRAQQGDVLDILAFRRDELMRFTPALDYAKRDSARLSWHEQGVRAGWLGKS